MNLMVTLIRRELWEHRVLWIAPLVAAALLIAVALGGHAQVEVPRDVALDDRGRLALFALMQWAFVLPQYLLMLIVLFFYLLDCLYAERRDRSILFWKSMPVSDGQTVASKLLTALLVVPLGVFVLALLADLVFAAIIGLRFGDASAFVAWDTHTWLKLQALMLFGLMIAMLWYAPVAAWLLLISAWARRNLFLWAVLPPVFAVMLERIALGTDRIGDFLRYRLFGIWRELGVREGLGDALRIGGERLPRVDRLFDVIDASPVLGDPHLWLGLLFAAALVRVTIRIRRRRDDR